ncbi:MAG: sigma-70 family RNA polymerase sigma factor [Planctomycetaceae bacterium]
MTADTSLELFARCRDGDEAAAEEVFGRYLERLTRLARSRLSNRLRARIDPEDVVLSAYRSFFIRARDGRFDLSDGGDLWRLLAAITLHKLRRQAARHSAEKRAVGREVPFDAELIDPAMRADDAAVEESAALADELEAFLRELPEFDRRVIELRLQGATTSEIARDTGRSERTVRRALAAMRGRLESRLERDGGGRGIAVAEADRPRESAAREMRSGRVSSRRSSPRSTAEDPRMSLRFEDYTLRRMIGAGGMGKVYEARQHSRDRLVAVKFLRKEFLGHPRAVDRFVHEAGIVADLNHPHIIGVHGIGGTPGGGRFIAMDLIAGPDLSRFLGGVPAAIADAIEWTRQLANALVHAHAAGIVHCDLKPANLLRDASGRIVVTDFGLAQSAVADPESRLLAGGTPAYMAPEQIEPACGPIGPHTDIHGAGAVLFALLTGRPPYDGKRPADVFAQILAAHHAPSPSAIREGIPSELETICRRCLAPRIADRYETASELCDALVALN